MESEEWRVKSGEWRVKSEVKERCVIIGASPVCDTEKNKKSVCESDFVVCADGGYKYAFAANVKPDLIIGDFDSAEFPENVKCDIVKLPVHKDDTDTMYCVRECMKMGYKEILLFGMTGGRLDHTFANFCTLLYMAENAVNAKMVDGENIIFAMTEGMKEVIENRNGHIFSIFPFGCASCEVTLDGFEYPLDKGMLKANFPLGVSNCINLERAEINLHKGSAICIMG